MESAHKRIQHLYNSACEIAFQEVDRLARIVLSKNKTKTKHFCMAMGTFSFYHLKDGDSMWDHQEEKLIGWKSLQKFIGEWDEYLKITGNPLSITLENGTFTTQYDW